MMPNFKLFTFVLGALLITAWISIPTTSQAETRKVYGLELPPYATELSQGRYKSNQNFKKTLKDFKRRLRRRSKILEPVTLMGVKYVHIRSTNPKTKWSGINVYELKGRKVRFYVLPRHKK
jgi:hypothetical protein